MTMIMTRKELNEREMMMANGGVNDGYLSDEGFYCYKNELHYGCGGHISGKGNPFVSCKCDKCGESHYYYDAFFGYAYDGYEEF